MSMELKIVDESNFQSEVLDCQGLVLVDFWATWCGPCKMMLPVLEDIAASGVKVCKLNVDENPLLTQQYSLSALPTLAFFNAGGLVRKLVGMQSKAFVLSEIERFKTVTVIPPAPLPEIVMPKPEPTDETVSVQGEAQNG